MNYCAVMKSAHVLFSMPVTISSLLAVGRQTASYENGSMNIQARLQILEEERCILENMTFDTIYWGDHGNNIISSKGRLPASRELFLKKIDHAIATHPVTKAGSTSDMCMVDPVYRDLDYN